LESIDKKHQIQESLDEYLTIFNIYKQFHKKPEDKKTDISPSKSDNKPAPPAGISDAQVSDLAQLITVAQNNT
jgi:hypothetical protein